MRMTAKTFHEHDGVDDWRVLYWGAYAHYRVASLTEAAEFALAVAAATGEHPPDLDLRPEGVTVRTFASRDGTISDADVVVAQRVSEIAHERGLASDPSRLQVAGIAIAQDEGVDTRPFWMAAFGYDELEDSDAIDPQRRGPHLWFHRLRDPRPGRGRFHIDLSVPADQAEARVRAALAAGGRLADDSHAPEWWTLASPENHGVDIAAWPDIEDYPQ